MKRYTERQLQRRANILAAARDLIAERGYDGVTMRALAERSGVALKTLYSQFTDKDTLLRSAVEEAHRATYYSIHDLHFNSGLDKLLHIVKTVAGTLLENEAYSKTLAPVLSRGVSSTEFSDVRAQAYRSAVVQIAAEGDLDPAIDIDVVTHMLLRQVASIYYEWARGEITTKHVGTVLQLQILVTLAGLTNGASETRAKEEVPKLIRELPASEAFVDI